MKATGIEWVVDAHGCDPARLRSLMRLRAVFRDAIRHHDLHPVAPAVWHQFPGAAGITGVQVLAESHVACHTYPERAYAAFNLYSCRDLPPWDWAQELQGRLGAQSVRVRAVRRGGK